MKLIKLPLREAKDFYFYLMPNCNFKLLGIKLQVYGKYSQIALFKRYLKIKVITGTTQDQEIKVFGKLEDVGFLYLDIQDEDLFLFITSPLNKGITYHIILVIE